MKKLIFIVLALLVVGGVAYLMAQGRGTKEDMEQEDDEDCYECYIEPMSDKNIYFIPDTVLTNNPVADDMVDMANSYAILHAAYCDVELWYRFGMVVNDEIGKIRTYVIKDDSVRTATEEYVRRLTELLPRDTALWNPEDSVLWNKAVDAYSAYEDVLSQRYDVRRYGKATKKNMGQTADFDSQCLHAIEYTHKHRNDEPHTTIPVLEKLMTTGKYSHQLFEVWLTWRTLRQTTESPSRDGVILNLEYNRMRHRCMNTILRRIVRNPKDFKAICEFNFFAIYDNIIRYSSYLFGNSAPLDYIMLFPEIKDE